MLGTLLTVQTSTLWTAVLDAGTGVFDTFGFGTAITYLVYFFVGVIVVFYVFKKLLAHK